MNSEATRYETYLKDSYNFTFGMIGGRRNKYNSPGHGKPTKKPRKPRKQRGTGHNNNHNHNGIDDDNDNDDDDEDDNNHHEQSQPPQQGVFQPAPRAYPCIRSAIPVPMPSSSTTIPKSSGCRRLPWRLSCTRLPRIVSATPRRGYGNNGGGHMM